MSPEQTRGLEVTAASDVFSLASTLTYAVAGQAPFGEGTGVDVLHRVAFDAPREEVLDKVVDVDAELAAFIRTCLDKDPEQRPLPEMVFRTAIGHQLSASTGGLSHAARKRPSQRAPFQGERSEALPAATPTESPAHGATAAPAASRKRGRFIVGAATAAVLVAAGVTVTLLHQGDGRTSAATRPETSPAVSGNPTPTPGTSKSAPPPHRRRRTGRRANRRVRPTRGIPRPWTFGPPRAPPRSPRERTATASRPCNCCSQATDCTSRSTGSSGRQRSPHSRPSSPRPGSP